MKNLAIHTNPDAAQVFARYPKHIRAKMLLLRSLILDTANDIAQISDLEETLKWGEPSYLTKKGSTIRIDWKPKSPDQYAIYFKCTSRLVDTFKLIFQDTFQYEGNRAIVFGLDDSISVDELKACIQAALTYHSVKHLPTLGI